jgi:hypothetical protein
MEIHSPNQLLSKVTLLSEIHPNQKINIEGEKVQQLQPTNPKKQPNFKTQPNTQIPVKKSYRKSHNNNQTVLVELVGFFTVLAQI